jgi:hypothetical protein
MIGLNMTMRGHKCQQLCFKPSLRCHVPEGARQRAPQHRSPAAEVFVTALGLKLTIAC